MVLVPVAALFAVLLISLLSFVPAPNAGGGGNGSDSGANANQKFEGSETDSGAGNGSANESTSEAGSDSQQEQNVDAGSPTDVDADNRQSQLTEAGESQDAGSNTTSEVTLPEGVSINAPHSKRKVRNTFNPFGSIAPPMKPTVRGEPTSGEVGKSAEFFGVAAEGKSFVYVVDKSSSMFIDKFDAARAELIESIDGLKPNQSFFVIFFDTSYYAQETDGMVRATPRNKRKVKDWAMMAVSSGGTEPYAAIEQAVELRPDAIFVLSDGEFDPYVVEKVRLINRQFTIPIHTIAFTTNSQTLKTISDQNRGTYRFVP